MSSQSRLLQGTGQQMNMRTASAAASHASETSDMDDGETPAVARRYGHISTETIKNSRQRKQKAMMKFLDRFNQVQYSDTVAKRDVRYGDISHHYVGEFANFMAKDARKNCKWDDGEPLSLNTTIGYLSSFKAWVQEKWMDSPCPDALTGQHWTRVLANVSSVKVAYARSKGIRIVNPHEVADDEDRIAFGSICIWNNDMQSAEFHHLMCEMCHGAGR